MTQGLPMRPAPAFDFRKEKATVSGCASAALRLATCAFIVLCCLPGHHAYAQEVPRSAEKQFKIALFKESGFPAAGVPASLTPEWLYACLSGRFSVTYVDAAQLSDRGYLRVDNFDLLLLPYGESFPYQAFDSIKAYLFQGGGFLHLAGRPFWAPMRKNGGVWEPVPFDDPYGNFLAPLGIKYYELLDSGHIGLSVTTSLGITPLQPTAGNVFPYRTPARDFYSLEDAGIAKEKYPGILVKSWQNPYVGEAGAVPKGWCLVGARGAGHPLNPDDPTAEKTLVKILTRLSSALTVWGLETNLAAYRQGEGVDISVHIGNSAAVVKDCQVEFQILDQAERLAYRKISSVSLKPGIQMMMGQHWRPRRFKDNFYTVRVNVYQQGDIVDRQENGFVVIDQRVLKNGPALKTQGNRFLIRDKPSLILGVNYYESKLGELMWLRPNLLKIRRDLQEMRRLGVNFIRIHYHHSKWFRDYFRRSGLSDPGAYFDVADTTAFPSERSWRILDAILQLSQEQGLIFCVDIFSLVPAEMGDPIGWLQRKERIREKEKVEVQKKFAALLARRYKDIPGITWDLWNEPRLDNDVEALKAWAQEITQVFRRNGDRHLITIGDDLSLRMLDVLDYGCIHTYHPGEFVFSAQPDKPVIFQEVWNDAGSGLADELRQSEKIKKDFSDFLKTGAAGFAPWQWTRQARLWNNASQPERWDDELGVCVHDDGTLKPAGLAYGLLIGRLQERHKEP
jgi:hypothetical protein